MSNTVELDFKVVATKATSELEKLNKGVTQVGKSVSTTRLALANIGAQAAIAGIKAVTSAIRGITSAIGSTTDAAAQIEGLTTRFEVLLKSTSAAKNIMEELQNFAATTPFQLPGIADTAAQLLAFQVPQEQIINKLQVLGDVAGASGSSLKELGLIFGQVSAAGKLTGERLLQLQERGVPIGPALAKTMGIAETSIRDAVSAGQVDFKTFEKAFESLNKTGAFAFEGMIKSSQTYKGVLSTLNDNIDLLQAGIGQKFLPVFKTAAIEMIKLIQSNKDVIIEWVEKGIILAIESLQSMVGYINPVIGGFKLLGAAVTFVKDIIQTQFNAAKTIVVGAVTGIIYAIEKLVGFMPASLIPDGWEEGIANTRRVMAEETQSMAKDTAESFVEIGNVFNNVRDAFEGTISEEGLENIKGILDRTKEAITKHTKDTAKVVDKGNKDVNKKTESLYGGMAGFVGEYKSFEDSTQKERVSNLKSTLGSMASLTSSNNKTLFAIGKASAISTATIDGIAAVQKALASAPPPFNYALAALVGVAQASNLAKIASAKPPAYADGGIVSGTSYVGDQVSAQVNSGEMILNKSQQSSLFNQINSGSSSNNSDIINAINNLGNKIAAMEIVVQSNDYEIARSVKRATDDGFSLA